MTNLPLEVVEMFGQTIVKVVPVTIALALVFSVLTHFWACNPGTPWWRKRELVTDICYWFFVPLCGRVMRIGLLVLGAGVLFKIHDADELIAFYDNGHGPLAELVDRALVAEHPVDLPVRRDGTRVHDPHMPLGRDLFELTGFDGHARTP